VCRRQGVSEGGCRSDVDSRRVDEHNELLQFTVDEETATPVESSDVSVQF